MTETPIVEKKILEMTPDSTAQCATFHIYDEDHTIGNSLRFVLNKNPRVVFCGYSIPHPLENKMNLHIQTRGTSATMALRSGLNDITAICDHLDATFNAAIQEHPATEEANE